MKAFIATFILVCLGLLLPSSDAKAQFLKGPNVKLTTTTNGLVVEDTTASSQTYRRKVVLRKGAFTTLTRGSVIKTFAVFDPVNRVIVDLPVRGVRVVGTTAAADNTGDLAKLAAIDLFNQ